MEQQQQRCPSGVVPDINQQHSQVMQSAQMGQPMQANQADVPPGASPVNTPDNVKQRQAVQELLQILRSPRSPEQREQILSILKANPPITAAFTRLRQRRLNQQAGGGPSQDGSGNDAPTMASQDQLIYDLERLCLDKNFSDGSY